MTITTASSVKQTVLDVFSAYYGEGGDYVDITDTVVRVLKDNSRILISPSDERRISEAAQAVYEYIGEWYGDTVEGIEITAAIFHLLDRYPEMGIYGDIYDRSYFDNRISEYRQTARP